MKKIIIPLIITMLAMSSLSSCIIKPSSNSEETTEAETRRRRHKKKKSTEDETTKKETTEEETTKEETTEETKEVVKSDVVLSDNLYDFQIQIDGTVFTLPQEYSSIVSSGWTLKDSDENETIQANSKYGVLVFKNSKDHSFMASGVNFDINARPVKETYITSITADQFLHNEDIDVVLAKGITLGKSTLDEVKAAYGEPNSEYNGSSSNSITYSKDGDKSIQLMFSGDTNLLDNIRIENVVKPENLSTGNSEVSTDVPQAVIDYKAPEAISDNPTDFAFSFDDMLISLPTPVSVFTANGWEISKDESKDIIAGNDNGRITMYKDNKKLTAICDNYSENATIIENTFVTSVVSDDYQSNIPIEIFKGIKKGMTQAELEQALNGIDYKKDESSSSIISYEIGKIFQKYTIYVKKAEGIVYRIEVSHTK